MNNGAGMCVPRVASSPLLRTHSVPNYRKGKQHGGLNPFLVSFFVLWSVSLLIYGTRSSSPEASSSNGGPVRGDHAAAASRAAALEQWRQFGVQNSPPEKYITFLLCKGYCDQLMAFADGIAVCYLLNATCVLPKWYRAYNPAEPGSLASYLKAQYDPQAAHAVDMDHYYDVDYFIRHMAGLVKVVKELPPWLDGDASGALDVLRPVDPARPNFYDDYGRLLRRKDVLRLRCTLNLVLWNTVEMGALRSALHRALRPGVGLQAALEARQAALAAALGLPTTPLGEAGQGPGFSGPGVVQLPPYLAVHVRDEGDWQLYCKGEDSKGEALSQAGAYSDCYKTAAEVGQQLAAWGLHKQYRHLYVANGAMSESKAKALMAAGQFEVLLSPSMSCRRTRGEVRCEATQPTEDLGGELNVAVDLAMFEASDFFVGNVYTELSWLARLGRLMRRDRIDAPPDTLYYNMDPVQTAGDLHKVETGRFTMQAGVLFPSWHAQQLPTYHQLHLQRQQGECLHKFKWGPQCGKGTPLGPPPAVTALGVTEGVGLDSGYITVKGWLMRNSSGLDWHPQISIFVNGKARGDFVAYGYEPLYVGHQGSLTFQASVPILPQDLSPNHHGWRGKQRAAVSVCMASGSVVCSEDALADVAPALRRDYQKGKGVLWMWLPGRFRSGAPEALHQLHQEVNKWHAKGEIALRSIFPGGDEFYRGAHSDFVPFLDGPQLGPRDYVMVPEHFSVKVHHQLQRAMKEVGAQGLVWHLGQHVTRLAISVAGKEDFKPICLSPYVARMIECPLKAIINVPMAEVFSRIGREEDAYPTIKEDLVLFDADDTFWFNPGALTAKLPPHVKVVLLKDYNRTEVIALMRRAKVYLDTYLTGNERGVFESALLNAVPIVADQGPGKSWHDFPLPQRYKWKYHDYDQLAEVVRFALDNYPTALREVRPFKKYVYSMPSIMSESARTYFQDDVHVMVPLVGAYGGPLDNSQRYAAYSALLFAAIQYPFSTQEMVIDNVWAAEHDAAGILYHLDNVGLLPSYTGSQLLPEYRRFGPNAVYVQRPHARHYRDFTLILPPNRIPLHPNLAAAVFKAAYKSDYVAVFGPDGVVLANWGAYYDLVNANLFFLDDTFTTRDLQQLLTNLGRPFLVIDRLPEVAEEQWSAVPWMPVHRCSVATFSMMATQPKAACFCKDFLQVTSQPLWTANFNKIPEDTDFREWMTGVQKRCEALSTS